MRRVTFSRNYTLSLSRTCRCYCKYCAFATHRAHLHAPAEVLGMLDDAARRGSKELLVLTGEKPEVNAEVAQRLRDHGHDDFTSYVVWACERALERGLLPHSNLGVLGREDLERLREVNASMGLMLRVGVRAPDGHRARRLADEAPRRPARDDRGRGRAAHPLHERHPGRHRRERGGTDGLARGARRGAVPARPHPGGDPPELRAPPALSRPGGGGDRGPGRPGPVVRERRGRDARRTAARVGKPDHDR